MGTWLNLDHPYLWNWGTMRCSLELLEKKMQQQGSHHSYLIPTWRYVHSKFPKIRLWDKSMARDDPLTITTGLRYSLDFSLKDNSYWEVERRLWIVFQDPEFKELYGKDIDICASSRRSFGHQGQQDPLEAPCARNGCKWCRLSVYTAHVQSCHLLILFCPYIPTLFRLGT